MMVKYRERLHAKSAALLLSIEGGLPRLMTGWLLVAALGSALRVATSPLHGALPPASTLLPYFLLVLAPFGAMVLSLGWFAQGDRLAQPVTRLARAGRWTNVSRETAMSHPLYGTSGIMVSLLVGMLLNVPVRAAEYLASMPAIAGRVPQWLNTLHAAMTLDVVLLSSLYVVAFVAALRRVPLFPRLLAAIWMIDLSMQMTIAKMVAGTEGLPPAVAHSLESLLDGNVKKVLISVALWLPYLLMSSRVNVTYRHRIGA